MNRLTKYENPMATLVNEVLDTFCGPFVTKESYIRESVDRDESGYTIQIALPGIPQEDLNVDYQSGRLQISHKDRYLRGYQLPDNIVVENISAELRNGILAIKIPIKSPPIVKIEVKKGI